MGSQTIRQSLERDIDALAKHIDADYLTRLCAEQYAFGDHEIWGGVHAGSDAEHRAADYLAREMKAIGLRNVERVPVVVDRFQFNDARITIAEPGGNDAILRPYAMQVEATPPGGVTAEVVDVDTGTKRDYADKDVTRRIALLEFNFAQGWMPTYPIHEAKSRGAAGVILYSTKDTLYEDTIQTQQMEGDGDIPAVSICAKDAAFLKRLLEENEKLRINLTIDTELVIEGGTSYQVVGEIPGETTDEFIVYAGHYEHFFRCLQDNIAAPAALLGMARAMIDSGYVPNRTIVFALTGAHEVGKVDSLDTHCRGVWELVRGPRSGWCGKALANITLEYPALPLNRLKAGFCMENASLYENFLTVAPESSGGFESVDPEGSVAEAWITWGDHYSFGREGIPFLVNDPVTEQFVDCTSPYVGRDHSNHDNWETFDREALKSITEFFGALGIYIDRVPALELNFQHQVERLRSSMAKDAFELADVSIGEFQAAIEDFENAAKAAYSQIRQLNDLYGSQKAAGMDKKSIASVFEAAMKANENNLRAFKTAMDGLSKLTAAGEGSVGHKKLTDNILLLSKCIALLESGDVDTVLDQYLYNIDLTYYAYHFSKKVLDRMHAYYDDESKKTWSAGKAISCVDLWGVTQMLNSKYGTTGSDFSKEILMLQKALSQEIALLPGMISMETACIRDATTELKKIDLSNAIDSLAA